MHFCYSPWLIILAGITNHDEYSLIYETLDDKEKMSTLKKGSTIARMERKKLEEMKKKLQTDDECEFGFIFLLFKNYAVMHVFFLFWKLESVNSCYWISATYAAFGNCILRIGHWWGCLRRSIGKCMISCNNKGSAVLLQWSNIYCWYQECIFLDRCGWLSFTCCCCRVLICNIALYIVFYIL